MGAQIGRTLVGLVVICSLVGVGAPAYPVSEFPLATPGPLRDAFLLSTTEVCFRNQRAAPENTTESDADLKKFCRCVAEAVAGQTRREDIDYQKKNHTVSPAIAGRTTQAASTCAHDLFR
jgi:hypothetical protein